MRTGKYCAQASHASMGSLFSIRDTSFDAAGELLVIPLRDPFVKAWVLGNFRKITLSVSTDEELQDLYSKAKEAGLACSLIMDSGLTEFNNVPTLTALGIGPGSSEEIDKITGSLPLF